jgi:hypothetical protein
LIGQFLTSVKLRRKFVCAVKHKFKMILCTQKYTKGFCTITDCRMELLYKQFSQFKARVNSQYHAKRNQKLEAIIKDHQHQSRAARISRPILPESNKTEDLEAWRVGQLQIAESRKALAITQLPQQFQHDRKIASDIEWELLRRHLRSVRVGFKSIWSRYRSDRIEFQARASLRSRDPLWRPEQHQPRKPFMRVLMTQEQLQSAYDTAWHLTLQRQRVGNSEQGIHELAFEQSRQMRRAIQHDAMVKMYRSSFRMAKPARMSPSPTKELDSIQSAKQLQTMPQGRHRPSSSSGNCSQPDECPDHNRRDAYMRK